MASELWIGDMGCTFLVGLGVGFLGAAGGGFGGVGLGSVLMRWPSIEGCVLLHLWIGFIGLGLGVDVGVMFGLASGLLVSFLILRLPWVGGGAFVFSLGIFMGGAPTVGSVAALVGVSWAGSGVAFSGGEV